MFTRTHGELLRREYKNVYSQAKSSPCVYVKLPIVHRVFPPLVSWVTKFPCIFLFDLHSTNRADTPVGTVSEQCTDIRRQSTALPLPTAVRCTTALTVCTKPSLDPISDLILLVSSISVSHLNGVANKYLFSFNLF